MIKSKTHDGYVFYWTTLAIQSNSDQIGFYFDDLGLPQKILRKSLYGEHILRWETTQKN